jgi:hypothetical protein
LPSERPSFEILRLWGHAKAQNRVGYVPASHRIFANDCILLNTLSFKKLTKQKLMHDNHNHQQNNPNQNLTEQKIPSQCQKDIQKRIIQNRNQQ